MRQYCTDCEMETETTTGNRCTRCGGGRIVETTFQDQYNAGFADGQAAHLLELYQLARMVEQWSQSPRNIGEK